MLFQFFVQGICCGANGLGATRSKKKEKINLEEESNFEALHLSRCTSEQESPEEPKQPKLERENKMLWPSPATNCVFFRNSIIDNIDIRIKVFHSKSL